MKTTILFALTATLALPLAACGAPGPDADGWSYLRCESVHVTRNSYGGPIDRREFDNLFRHNGETIEIRRPGRWDTLCDDIPERFAQSCTLSDDALSWDTVAERWSSASRIDLSSGAYSAQTTNTQYDYVSADTQGGCRAVAPPEHL